MASPQASSSAPYKLPAAPLIARNLSTLLSNGSTTTASSALPIASLRDLLTESRPPLLNDDAQAGSSAAHTQAQTEPLDGLPIIDPHTLLLTTSSNPSLQQQLAAPQARADILDLAQGLALALARPQDGDSVAAGPAGSSASSSASAILSLVESRLLLASCYVVLALLPPAIAAPAENGGASQSSSGSSSNAAARLAQAGTQLDVARDELREAQRSHQSQVKAKKRTEVASSSAFAVDQAATTLPDEDGGLLTQQLAQHQARLLLASANVAHLSGRPEHEVRRLLGWWAKARGQGQAQMGVGGGCGAEGTRGDKAGGVVAG